VDDVHWADRASLRFLAFLLPRLEELRAMVALAARPAEAGASRELMAAVTMDPATEVVTLRPLTVLATGALIAALVERGELEEAYSSPPARSKVTSLTCSPSWTSGPAPSCWKRWRRRPARPRLINSGSPAPKVRAFSRGVPRCERASRG